MAAITCRSYTHARRFPLVIGRIGGYALPTPLTPAQVAVLLGGFWLLGASRRLWAVLPGPADVVVALALPIVAAWAVRHARVEGRSPFAFALGLLRYLSRPRHGVRHGHPERASRPVMLLGTVTVS